MARTNGDYARALRAIKERDPDDDGREGSRASAPRAASFLPTSSRADAEIERLSSS
jgi:hypothetical protein